MVTKELDQYTVDCTLLLKNVTVEDAGKYKVTARNDLGESNATITLNFDSKCFQMMQLRSFVLNPVMSWHGVKVKIVDLDLLTKQYSLEPLEPLEPYFVSVLKYNKIITFNFDSKCFQMMQMISVVLNPGISWYGIKVKILDFDLLNTLNK